MAYSQQGEPQGRVSRSRTRVLSAVRGPSAELYTLDNYGGLHVEYRDVYGVYEVLPGIVVGIDLDIKNSSLYCLDNVLMNIFIIEIKSDGYSLINTIRMQSHSYVMLNPLAISVLENSNIAVSDQYGHVIYIMTNQGDLLHTLGQPGMTGNSPELLNEPRGVFEDDLNNILVGDALNSRVQVFSPHSLVDGAALGSLQLGRQGPTYPQRLCISNDTLAIIENYYLDDFHEKIEQKYLD